MKIVLFHPVRLPPADYGGVERVVLWLARGLIERGHEVHVAALEGSRLPAGARLLPITAENRSAAELPARLPPGVEVVHFMAPPESETWEKLPCAGVVTVHGNGKTGEVFHFNSVFLSLDHARRHGAQAFVHNGIDPEELAFTPGRKGSSYLFLSKTSWGVKNLRGAMRIARRSAAPLWIAGGNRPLGARLEAWARPSMRWFGPVAGAEKARLLAESRALIFPVLWPEPFGLVVVEALMSGTPVIASRKGSLAELVPPEAGLLLPAPTGPAEEALWVEALRKPGPGWDSQACRDWAMSKFHYREMAAGYERLYRRAASGDALNPAAPRAGDWRNE